MSIMTKNRHTAFEYCLDILSGLVGGATCGGLVGGATCGGLVGGATCDNDFCTTAFIAQLRHR